MGLGRLTAAVADAGPLIHLAEIGALSLLRNVTRVAVIFTDDLAARDAARRLGLTPVGSLGIVVRSYRLGDVTLDEAEHHIGDLQRVSTLFVTGRLVDLVLEELRRAPT